MPIILAGFCLLPFIIALIIMYLVCLKSGRWYIRVIPPIIILLLAGVIAFARYQVWASTTVPPWTQLIFFPGLPTLFILLGMLVGWRLWWRRWRPRVVKDKKK